MQRIEDLRADLRAALLAGENTGPIRQAIAAAEAEQRAHAERQKGEAAERDAAEAEHIRQCAETIAADAVARLAAVLEPLRPPSFPVSEGAG